MIKAFILTLALCLITNALIDVPSYMYHQRSFVWGLICLFALPFIYFLGRSLKCHKADAFTGIWLGSILTSLIDGIRHSWNVENTFSVLIADNSGFHFNLADVGMIVAFIYLFPKIICHFREVDRAKKKI